MSAYSSRRHRGYIHSRLWLLGISSASVAKTPAMNRAATAARVGCGCLPSGPKSPRTRSVMRGREKLAHAQNVMTAFEMIAEIGSCCMSPSRLQTPKKSWMPQKTAPRRCRS